MADSTNDLDQITTAMVQPDVVINANFDAASPAMGFGRKKSTTTGLTWGYNEAVIDVGGVPTKIPAGTIALTASATNYLYRVAGAVTKVTSPPAGWRTTGGITSPSGAKHVYEIVTGPDTVTSHEDLRFSFDSTGGGSGSPGGSNTQVQFNDSGAFGGDAGLTYNKTTDTLTAATFVGALTGTASGNLVAADIANAKIANIEFVINGGGSAITTGVKGDLRISFACTINSVTLLADQSGSIVVDIWRDSYANYPPVVGDSITASAKPTLSSADKSENTTLTGWTTSITAGDTLRFNVDSASTVTRVTVALKVTKT